MCGCWGSSGRGGASVRAVSRPLPCPCPRRRVRGFFEQSLREWCGVKAAGGETESAALFCLHSETHWSAVRTTRVGGGKRVPCAFCTVKTHSFRRTRSRSSRGEDGRDWPEQRLFFSGAVRETDTVCGVGWGVISVIGAAGRSTWRAGPARPCRAPPLRCGVRLALARRSSAVPVRRSAHHGGGSGGVGCRRHRRTWPASSLRRASGLCCWMPWMGRRCRA